jgi:hypothetical protein
MSVRKRLSGRRRNDPHIRLSVEKFSEDVDEETKDLDKEDEQIPVSGPSNHHLPPPRRAPELFRHLSLPDEDRHDLYDRPKISVKFNSAPDTRDDIEVNAHSSSSSEDRKKPDKDDGKLKLAGEDNPEEEEADEEEEEDEPQDRANFDEHAFDHPSTYKAQQCVWIPRDTLGLSGVLVEELTSVGITASDEGAVMDERGIVEVQRGPPDEEWLQGIDR